MNRLAVFPFCTRTAAISSIIFILLFFDHQVSAQSYDVRHLAGSIGGLGDMDGIGLGARFRNLAAVWGDGTYLYVGESYAIRRVTVATGQVITIAGSATEQGSLDAAGLRARFQGIRALWGVGNILYIADSPNIRQMNLATGDVSTFLTPGTDSATQFRNPISLWSDGATLYFAEEVLQTLRFTTPGSFWKVDIARRDVARVPLNIPQTFQPTPSHLAVSGRELLVTYNTTLNSFTVFIVGLNLDTGATRTIALNPSQVAIAGESQADDGFLYISSQNAIERIKLTTGDIQRVAGTENYQDWIDDAAADTKFRMPTKLWGDSGRLYILDSGNYAIRSMDLQTLQVTTLAGAGVRDALLTDLPPSPPVRGGLWSDGSDLYYLSYRDLNFRLAWDIRKLPLKGGDSVIVAPDISGVGVAGLRDLWGDSNGFYTIEVGSCIIKKISRDSGETSNLAGSQCVTSTVDGSGSQATLRFPQGLWGDGVYLYFGDTTLIRRVSVRTGEVTTVAGQSVQGIADGPAAQAQFDFPRGFWGDSSFLYIADYQNNVVRKMSLSTFEVSTIAGRARMLTPLNAFDDGIGFQAVFHGPHAIWGDGTFIYVADSAHTVRKVNPVTTEVTTIAGLPPFEGLTDGIGSGARFGSLDSFFGIGSNLYLTDNGRLRVLNLTTREATTVLGRPVLNVDGQGAAARLGSVSGLWGDGRTLYFGDSYAIRTLDIGTARVTTVAGWMADPGVKDGVGNDARFSQLTAMCGNSHYLYVGDGHSIRKVTIGSWNVTTFAGQPELAGNSDGTGAAARFGYLQDLFCSGTYIYADADNQSLRRISTSTDEVTTLATGLPGNGLCGDGRYLYIGNAYIKNAISRFDLTNGGLSVIGQPFTNIDASGGMRIWGDGGILYFSFANAIARFDISTVQATVIAGAPQIAGSEDGRGINARFSLPGSIWGDSSTLYVSDFRNFDFRVIDIAAPALSSNAISFSISSLAAMSRSTGGGGSDVTVGYARIQSQPGAPEPAGVAIFSLRKNGVVVSETAVPAAPLVQTARLFAENGSGVRTGLAIVNPNAAAVTLSFNFTDERGRDFGAGSLSIPANAQISAFLDEMPFASGAPQLALSSARSFTFASTAPVAAIALRGFVNERGDFLMTTLPVADISQVSFDTTIIPHFAQGGGWTTQVPLLNPTAIALTGTVEIIDPLGTTINTERYTIPSASAAVIQLSAGSALQTGWIRIIPDSKQASPVGTSIFSFVSNGVTVTESGIQATAASPRMLMYVENSGTVQSALALANDSPVPVTVIVRVTDTTGRDIGLEGQITLPARGQRSVFVTEVPGLELLPSEFSGLLRITTNGAAVSAIGLRGRYNERGDFLIAATPPASEAATVTGELFFPQIADGAGFSTEFILFNSATGLFGGTTNVPSSAGSVRFYAQSGDPLTLSVR